MGSLRVKPNDIAIGEGLPWPMFDSEGRLLLKKGTVIANQGQLEALISRGLYRQAGEGINESGIDEKNSSRFQDTASPFLILDEMVNNIPELFRQIISGQSGVEENIIRFCKKLHLLCQEEPDAMLGAVHVFHKYKYTEHHPVHVAILISIVGIRLGFPDELLMIIMAAGMTSNISMIELQETLFSQEGALTNDQEAAIKNHSSDSVKMLVNAGIYNAKWLEIVMQHHERPDGSGYPNGLKGTAISRESQLISIADRYSAMVSTREYRVARASNEALREFFMKKCDHCNEEMTLLFIKELGIWPPGSVVQLVNGETAIVIKRNNDSMWPIVSSIAGSNGDVFAHPLRRDCQYEEYRINSVTILNENIKLNLSMVWDYC